MSVCKQLLNKVPVASRKTGVMDSDTIRQQFLQVFTIYRLLLYYSLDNLLAFRVGLYDPIEIVFGISCVFKVIRSSSRVSP